MLKEVGLESSLEGAERGFQTQGRRESVPDGWALNRERVGTKGGEFGAKDVQAERVRVGGEESERVFRGRVSWRGRWEQRDRILF